MKVDFTDKEMIAYKELLIESSKRILSTNIT